MPKRFSNVPDHMREPSSIRWSDVPNWYWLAIGVTLLLGLVTGGLWIAWKLITIHLLGWR